MPRFFGFEFPSVTGLFAAPSVNEVQSHQGGVPFNPTRDGITRGWTYDPMDQFSPPAYGVPADSGPSSGTLDRLMAFFDGSGNPPDFNWTPRNPRGFNPRVPDETGGVSYGVAPGGAIIPDETGGVSYHSGIPATGGGLPPEYHPGGDLSGLPYQRPGDGKRVTADMLAPGDPTPDEYQRSKDRRYGQGFLGQGAAFLAGASEYFTRQQP